MTRYTLEDQPAPAIAEIARTLEIRWKNGRDIVVTVKDAGHGRAVDVRTYLTADAYPPASTVADRNMHREGRGKNRVRTREDGYVGPTRDGWWLADLETAERLGCAILEAVEVARAGAREGVPA